jgi:aryl-alcohol dehydrogenase-like predicted oxidoreductase
MLKRREVLKSAAALAASSLLSPTLLAQTSPLVRKAIPSSGELLPVVGIGTNHYGHGIGEGNDAELIAPLREVLSNYADAGGGLIDTSVRYRQSEHVLGTLFKELGLNDHFFISTKIFADDAAEAQRQMADSADLLNSSGLDLVSVHNMKGWKTILPMLHEAKQEGTIRYCGITTADIPQYDEMIQLMKNEKLDFIQVNYSLRDRLAENEILKIAADRGIAVIANRAYNEGELFADVRGHEVPAWAADFDASSWGQIFLKYVVSHPAVITTIPGTTKLRHLLDNLGAAQGRLPDASQRKQIEDHYASIVG